MPVPVEVPSSAGVSLYLATAWASAAWACLQTGQLVRHAAWWSGDAAEGSMTRHAAYGQCAHASDTLFT